MSSVPGINRRYTWLGRGNDFPRHNFRPPKRILDGALPKLGKPTPLMEKKKPRPQRGKTPHSQGRRSHAQSLKKVSHRGAARSPRLRARARFLFHHPSTPCHYPSLRAPFLPAGLFSPSVMRQLLRSVRAAAARPSTHAPASPGECRLDGLWAMILRCCWACSPGMRARARIAGRRKRGSRRNAERTFSRIFSSPRAAPADCVYDGRVAVRREGSRTVWGDIAQRVAVRQDDLRLPSWRCLGGGRGIVGWQLARFAVAKGYWTVL